MRESRIDGCGLGRGVFTGCVRLGSWVRWVLLLVCGPVPTVALWAVTYTYKYRLTYSCNSHGLYLLVLYLLTMLMFIFEIGRAHV